MEPLVRIRGAAAHLGVSESTIKLYERRGLIPKPARIGAGHRVYTASDLELIRQVIVPGSEGTNVQEAVG